MKKTALITGSTSGIGLAIAQKMAILGYNICFNGLEAEGEQIAAEIARKHHIGHIFSAANLMDRHQTEQLAAQCLSTFGKIDVLVNNAGIQFVSPIDHFPDEKWDAIMAINVTAAFTLTKLLWPTMKAQKWGRVINMASAHGLTASPFKSAYVASKHAIIGFTKAIALEGAPLGITCNAICPGYVHTPIIDNQIADQMKAHGMSKEEVIEKVMLAKQPIKEFIPTGIIADMVAFLADEIAAHITGVALPIDGGWTAE